MHVKWWILSFWMVYAYANVSLMMPRIWKGLLAALRWFFNVTWTLSLSDTQLPRKGAATGSIIGALIGILLLLAIVITVVMVIRKRRNKDAESVYFLCYGPFKLVLSSCTFISLSLSLWEFSAPMGGQETLWEHYAKNITTDSSLKCSNDCHCWIS